MGPCPAGPCVAMPGRGSSTSRPLSARWRPKRPPCRRAAARRPATPSPFQPRPEAQACQRGGRRVHAEAEHGEPVHDHQDLRGRRLQQGFLHDPDDPARGLEGGEPEACGCAEHHAHERDRAHHPGPRAGPMPGIIADPVLVPWAHLSARLPAWPAGDCQSLDSRMPCPQADLGLVSCSDGNTRGRTPGPIDASSDDASSDGGGSDAGGTHPQAPSGPDPATVSRRHHPSGPPAGGRRAATRPATGIQRLPVAGTQRGPVAGARHLRLAPSRGFRSRPPAGALAFVRRDRQSASREAQDTCRPP